MNNNTCIIRQNKTIRFRRWSRKGYAVFSGLGKEITIGQIVTEISDKSLTKVKNQINEIKCLLQSVIETVEEPDLEENLLICNDQIIKIQNTISFDGAAYAFSNKRKIISNLIG